MHSTGGTCKRFFAVKTILTEPPDLERSAFKALSEAYTFTEYQVMLAMGRHVVLRIGETSPAADEVLAAYRAHIAAFITPENPGSKMLSDLENFQRCVAFERLLANGGFQYLRGTGKSADGGWPGENSFFIFNISEAKATTLAHSFGQNAFLMYEPGTAARLLWCNSVAD